MVHKYGNQVTQQKTGFQWKVKEPMSVRLLLRCRGSLTVASNFHWNWWCLSGKATAAERFTENSWSESRQRNCDYRSQELQLKPCLKPSKSSLFLLHPKAVKYLLDITLLTHPHQAIPHHYMLQMILTSYFLSETVESYYTAIGTSGENGDKFMPFALKNPARTRRVL